MWSWDITKLRGPAKWTCHYLYVILDIFSRYVTGWMVASRESAALAEVLIRQTCTRQGIGKDQLTIRAGRGSSMTSRPAASLLADLGITQSHSRPHVSDDNPCGDAQFKTLKYRPDLPSRFSSIEAAQVHCHTFFAWYNDQHRHSGPGLHTPPTSTTAPPRPFATSAPPFSMVSTRRTPNASFASRPSHRNCPPARGSTDPTHQSRPLGKSRTTVPQSG